MHHVRAPSQVETETRCAQAQEEHRWAIRVVLESRNDVLARFVAQTAVQERDLAGAQFGAEMLGEQLAGLAVLREHQRTLVCGGELGQHVGDPVELAGTSAQRVAANADEFGVVADLLEPRQQRQNLTAAADSGALLAALSGSAIVTEV